MSVDTIQFPVKRAEKSRLPEVNFDQIPFGKTYSDHMFVADYIDGRWTNMEIVPYGPIQISPASAVLHYAQEIFEGQKAYKSPQGDVLVFRPDENAKRMAASAKRLCMPPFPEDMFVEAIRQLVDLDRDWVPSKAGNSLYLRPFMFANDAFIGVKPSDNYKFMIITGPVGAYYPAPVKVKVETHYSRAFKGGTGYAKCGGNYAASLLPAAEARKQGFDQLLWTDAETHTYFEESGTMNLMFIIDGKIVTPRVSDTILHGITRKSIVELAKDLGYAVEERPVAIAEVMEAGKNGKLDDAFGVGTAATIAPIASITFEEETITLPAVSERKMSTHLARSLDDIRTGLVTDKYGWMVKI